MKKVKFTKGFTLIEMMIVLGVILVMMTINFSEIKKNHEFDKAKIAGEQIKTVGNAVNAYIVAKYDRLSQLSSATGDAGDLGPRICSGNICTINHNTLINEGLLPSTFTGKNINGSDYSIQLKRVGAAPNYIINGLIVTNKPWAEGELIRHDLLGKAMSHAGSDSGVSKNSSIIKGYSGVWSEKQSDFSIINKEGLLSYRAGYNSGMYSVYLRRDGTLPMTGDLNLDGHNINNIKDVNATGSINASTVNSSGAINAQGQISAKGNISSDGEVFARNGLGDSIAIGGDANDDYEIRLGSPKPLTIYSPHSTSYTTVMQILQGNMRISQRLGLAGTDPNALPAGWNGGLTTWDAYAAGTVAAGSGGGVSAYLNSAGDVYAQRNLDAGYIYSRGNIKAANTLEGNYIRSLGNIYAAGNIDTAAGISSNTVSSNYIHSNGNMDASGRITSGEYMQVNGVAYAGNGCSPNGLIGRDTNGSIMSCQSGVWKTNGGSDFNTGKPGSTCGQATYCSRDSGLAICIAPNDPARAAIVSWDTWVKQYVYQVKDGHTYRSIPCQGLIWLN